MNQRTIRELFALLRSAISDKKMTSDERECYSSEMLTDLLKISTKHDISHLFILGLKNNDLLMQEEQKEEARLFSAVCRYEQKNYELEQLQSVLEKAQIPFVPLKGTVLHRYYKEPWMRTSCDIDILVKQEDCQVAVEVLTKELGYSCGRTGNHDVSLTTPQNVHIELHYTLRRDGNIKNASEILGRVWDDSAPKKGHKYWLEMSDEMFYFHHIAHMAKHFLYGGCGIRPYLDLWILDNIPGMNKEKRDELLEIGGLLGFANACRTLSRIWFDGEASDSVSERMQEYILTGGVYGSSSNRIAAQQHIKGGKLKYAMSKVFLPYEELKYHYPVLQKKRWLTPIMEVRRWGKHLFGKDAGRAITELKTNQSSDANNKDGIKDLISSVGL